MPFEAEQQTSGFVPDSAPTGDSPFTSDVSSDAFRAGVYGKMLSTDPGYAYQNGDEIDRQFREINPDYDNDSLKGAIETGFEETPLGMLIRGKAPDPFESNNALLRFVHNTVSFASDPVVLVPTIAGAIADIAVPGAAVAGFVGGSALDAGLRKTMMDHYQKGDVKSFGELADRAGDALWAATKGALGAEAFSFAGDLPVPGAIAGKPLAATALRGLYQASAITTAGSLLDGRLPKLQDFEDSALAVVPLNLATGGLLLRGADAKQALMDTYSETGKTPQESSEKLNAQPPVKPEPPEGLRPAIKLGNSHLDGDYGETHDELADRLGQKPVTMEQLQADPSLALKVLESPETHSQEVIDGAWVLWDDALLSAKGKPYTDADEEIDRQRLQAQRGNLKSGQGFVSPEGKFLTRGQAEVWMKKNEPEVHKMWTGLTEDEKTPLHSEDYYEARDRVNARTVAEGADQLNSASPELNQFLGRNRSELNTIKAGDESSRYGKSVLRTLLSGPRNMLRAQGAQVVGSLKKLIPDHVDQEALSFLRDYRDDPDALRSDIEEVRSGNNEKLKAFIPSMERALNPSPEMMQADQQMTDYFKRALDLGRQTGTIKSSSIDPSRYSPRLFMKAMEDADNERSVGRPKFTDKTPHAIRREHLRLLDPLKDGDFEARTFNALDETSIYADRHATAVSTKLFTNELENTQLGTRGTPEDHPDGWQELNPGSRSMAGFYVPKAIAEAMKPMLEAGGLPSQALKFIHAQNYVKAIELSLSVFHMKSLTITAMNNMSFGDFSRSLKSDNSSAAFESVERQGALWGLETTKTGTPYEAYKGLKPSSIPTGLDKLSDFPIIKQVDAFAKSLTHETFDVIQRKFKVMDFAQKQTRWIAKNQEANDAEYGSAMRGIAKEVNSAYGGLNWDVLGVSKGMRDLSRLFILAPDWTFSNVANLKYATEGGPAGSAARAFWVKSFVTGIAMSQAASVLISGKTDLSHPTSVYLGEDKDGKKMYSNIFFAGAPKDAISLVNHVMKDGLLGGLIGFAANKFGPVASTGLGIAENRQFTGQPITKRGDTPIEKDAKNLKFAATQTLPVPFGIKDIAQLLTNPKTQDSKWDYVLPLLGTYATHESAKGSTSESKSLLPGGKRGGFHLPGATRKSGMRLPGQ